MKTMLSRICIAAALLAFAVAAIANVATFTKALDSDKRSAEDKARDANRKPAEVLTFLGLKPGMTVLDVMASGGWYTEVLSLAVGENGKVIAHNTPGALQFRGGANERAISERLANNRLPNVTRLNAEFSDLGLENEIDLAITALNFHDVYNRSPDAAKAMLEALKKALKPGGVLGVIDHAGNPDGDNNALHRINEQLVVSLAKEVGFEVESADLLRNVEDSRAQSVFSPDLRGNTDRFLLKLIKRS